MFLLLRTVAGVRSLPYICHRSHRGYVFNWFDPSLASGWFSNSSWLQSVTKPFGQNSKRAYVYNIIEPRTPVGKYLRKMFLASARPNVVQGGGGSDSVIMLNSIWKCVNMYILYHCPKTLCHALIVDTDFQYIALVYRLCIL